MPNRCELLIKANAIIYLDYYLFIDDVNIAYNLHLVEILINFLRDFPGSTSLLEWTWLEIDKGIGWASSIGSDVIYYIFSDFLAEDLWRRTK